MALYDRAMDGLVCGDRDAATKILEQNVEHWKEIRFYLGPADLAEKLGQRGLAAQLYELHGDDEREPVWGRMSRTSSYSKALQLYRGNGQTGMAESVGDKLRGITSPNRVVNTHASPFAGLLHR